MRFLPLPGVVNDTAAEQAAGHGLVNGIHPKNLLQSSDCSYLRFCSNRMLHRRKLP